MMMTVPMGRPSAPSSRELVQRLYKKNIELENGLRKSAQSKIPSDPNIWLQMRENYETIVLEDHDFSEQHDIEISLWQLHYRRIEEFRSHINAAPAAAAAAASAEGGKVPNRSDRVRKIRSFFKSFLSEATGFYHELMQKIRSKYGLPLGYFSEYPESGLILTNDGNKSSELKKGLLSCHRCLIYLGDLARYKGLYGEGDSSGRDYTTASSYYLQAITLWPSSGNPHHQLAILASYTSDELVAIYRYFRSLAVDNPFSTARDNLIIAFEKNRQIYSQLPGNAKVPLVKTVTTRQSGRGRGRGRGRGDCNVLSKDACTQLIPSNEKELSISEVFKVFSTRFVRLNGILYTRTSLETFGDNFSSIINSLKELLSSGPDEELNFGLDFAGNALFVLRLIAILIFAVYNVNKESEGQSYAEILQRSVLLGNAYIAAFEFVGHIVQRCTQLVDASSSYLLPGIMVFMEWLACNPDIASGDQEDDKQSTARSFYWKNFVTFLNNLLLNGLVPVNGDEDDACFSEMGRYEEGETENRLALWEDFELRGFSPLAPAQLILDFSKRHSFGSDGSRKEKKARIQRIIAAGRSLLHIVKVDHQGIYFDSKLKKFVIGPEQSTPEADMQTYFSDKPNGVKHELVIGDTVNFGQSHTESCMEGEEEDDEVIVFKPAVIEKHPMLPFSAAHDAIHSLATSTRCDLANDIEILASLNMPSQAALHANAHAYMHVGDTVHHPVQRDNTSTTKWFLEQGAYLSDVLRNTSIAENGYRTNLGLSDGLNPPQPITASLPFALPANTGLSSSHMNIMDTAVPSKFDSVLPPGTMPDNMALKSSTAMPIQPRKNPVSRPLRHSGPPPGFSPIPPKQSEGTSSSLVDQDALVDDYSWLDGYQPPSRKPLVSENAINQVPPHDNPRTRSMASAINFPFPGKQIPAVQAECNNDKEWQELQLIESLKLYSEKQHQTNQHNGPFVGQYQAQRPTNYYF